jgi:hypothetical protein
MKNLTIKETAVIEKMRKSKVTTKKKLCKKLGISHMTVVRAFTKVGYFTSYNKNSSFYTLQDTPDFDKNGLWTHEGVHFSKFFTLENTIVKLIERSEAGLTTKEIEGLLKTNVKNLLPRLISKSRLNRSNVGRYALYLSSDRKLKSKQEACRKRRMDESKAASGADRQKMRLLPENLDALTVIKILIYMIEFPSASVASISRSLQSQGVAIDAKKVQTVIDFYSLEKKTAH